MHCIRQITDTNMKHVKQKRQRSTSFNHVAFTLLDIHYIILFSLTSWHLFTRSELFIT